MIKKILLIVMVLGIFSISLVSADVIPEKSHGVGLDVKFVNLNEFPDIVLIAYVTGPLIENGIIKNNNEKWENQPYRAYEIKNNMSLIKGYKFNKLDLYWTTKEKFKTLKLDNLKLKEDNSPADLTLVSENMDTSGGGYVDEDDPLRMDFTEYSIAGFHDKKLIIYKSKEVKKYNNGKPNYVQIFEKPKVNNIKPNPEVNPTPQENSYPKNTGFWSKFVCFFKRLFGKIC